MFYHLQPARVNALLSRCSVTGHPLFVFTALTTDSIHSKWTCDRALVQSDDIQPEEKEEPNNGRAAVNVLVLLHLSVSLKVLAVFSGPLNLNLTGVSSK